MCFSSFFYMEKKLLVLITYKNLESVLVIKRILKRYVNAWM